MLGRLSFVVCLIITLQAAHDACASMPFAQEVRSFSTGAHQRPQLKQPAERAAERFGPVAPPLVDFIGPINDGLTLPSQPVPDRSPILRSFNPSLQLPAAYPMKDFNMRLPIPW